MKICKKVFQSKRKKFDSVEVRLGEHDNAAELIEKARRDAAPQKKAPGARAKGAAVPAWKKKSLEFRAAIMAARALENPSDEEANERAEEIQQQLKLAGNSPDPDKIKCEHCGRTFNKEAGARHIAICVKTFGSKPGGGRLLKNSGGLKMKTDMSTPTGAQSGQAGLFGRPTPTPSPTAAQAAKVSRMGSSGQSLDTSGLGPPTRGGGSSQVVRTSSGASGFSQGGYSASGGGYAKPPTAQARGPSAHRTPSRGGGGR